MTASWPQFAESLIDPAADGEIRLIIDAISEGRSVRQELNVPPSARPPLLVVEASETQRKALKVSAPLIAHLLHISDVRFVSAVPAGAISYVIAGATLAFPVAEFIELTAERTRLARELASLDVEADRLSRKLGNADFVAREPPPNEWTPVVGSLSPEVSNGTSTSVVYRGVQAPGRRAGGVEPSLGHVGSQGARSARLGAAALGRQVPAGAGIGGVAPHHAGDVDVGGPGFGHRPVAPGERTSAHGARYSKELVQYSGTPVRRRNSLVLPSAAGRVAAVQLLEAQSPLKNMSMGACELESGDVALATIPIRKMTIGR
jgi:hypothetical protein